MDICNIVQVYENEGERTLNHLSKHYSDVDYLKQKIINISNNLIDFNTAIKNKSILIKPNWVRHNLTNEDETCLRTNDSIIFALLEIILVHKPKNVLIGDAPIQGCNWDQMLSKDFSTTIKNLSKQHNVPIIIKDFRRVTFDSAKNNPIKNRNPLTDYLIFDLGRESNLEPISTEENKFRVTSYDPDRLAESHRKGVHKYCITKEFFEADIIISLPKVKTHQKAGITCALKNLVGINGDKDYLPHHRIGGTDTGGDCYPGKNRLRFLAERILDMANRQQGNMIYKPLLLTSSVVWKFSRPQKVHQIAAGWYGNDTTWRMVNDLNKIAVYGKPNGTVAETPQRQLFSLCDGIIAGQGDGPLNPDPLPLGILSFTNNSALNDICMATLMGFDYKKISLLKNQKINPCNPNIEILFNGERITFDDLSKYSIQTIAPSGWINHL